MDDKAPATKPWNRPPSWWVMTEGWYEKEVPAIAVPYCEVGASPLAKAMVKAFSYHPYGVNHIIFEAGWAVGPTWVVKTDPDVETWVNMTTGHSPYLPGIAHSPVSKLVQNIESLKPELTETLSLDSKGHSKAQEARKGKFGEDLVLGAGKCTCRALRPSEGPVLLEVGFPLIGLMKRTGTVEIRGYPSDLVAQARELIETPTFPDSMYEAVLGYDKNSELTGMFVAKRVEDGCDV